MSHCFGFPVFVASLLVLAAGMTPWVIPNSWDEVGALGTLQDSLLSERQADACHRGCTCLSMVGVRLFWKAFERTHSENALDDPTHGP